MQTLAAKASPASSLSTVAATIPGQVLIGLAATAVVAAAAHVAIPLPFTPVPLTLQPLAVLAVGLALGPVAGFFTMLAYLAEGALGLPVFAPSTTGLSGVAQLFGPTGGFLLAYPLVAAIVGAGARRLGAFMSKFLAAFIAGNAAMAVLLFTGATWLMHFAHLTVHQTWIAGVAPFLPGEMVKVLVAAGSYSALYRSNRIV
jgi:biotin transport system substrate-specific component